MQGWQGAQWAAIAAVLVACGGGSSDDDAAGTPAQETDADKFCSTATEINQALGLGVKFHERIGNICGRA